MRVWFDVLARNEIPSAELIAGVTRIVEAAERLEIDQWDWCQLWDTEIDVVKANRRVAIKEKGGVGHLRGVEPQTLLGRYQRARQAYFALEDQASPSQPK